MEPQDSPSITDSIAPDLIALDAIAEVPLVTANILEKLKVPENREAEHCFECGVCGYIYDPAAGESKSRIVEGTPFVDLPKDWRCPVCTTKKSKFSDIGLATKPSGFAENLGYGLGVNTLTPGQKNLLIFGGLALGFIFFISFYAID